MDEPGLRHEGAAAALLDQQALVHQGADRAADRAAAEAMLLHELVLGRDAGAGRPLARGDHRAHAIGELKVECRGRAAVEPGVGRARRGGGGVEAQPQRARGVGAGCRGVRGGDGKRGGCGVGCGAEGVPVVHALGHASS